MRAISFAIFLLSFIQLNAQSKMYWATTFNGGAHNAGAIVKLDSNGQNPQIVHSFLPPEASHPNPHMIEMGNRKIYGLLAEHEGGFLFEYDHKKNILKKKVRFRDYKVYPHEELIRISDHKILIFSRDLSDRKLKILEYDIRSNTLTERSKSDRYYYRFYISNILHHSNGNIYWTSMKNGRHPFSQLFMLDVKVDSIRKLADLELHYDFQALTEGSNGRMYALGYTTKQKKTPLLIRYDLESGAIHKWKFGKKLAYEHTFYRWKMFKAANDMLYWQTLSFKGKQRVISVYKFDLIENKLKRLTVIDDKKFHKKFNHYYRNPLRIISYKEGCLVGFIEGWEKLEPVFYYDFRNQVFLDSADVRKEEISRLIYHHQIVTSDNRYINAVKEGGAYFRGVINELDTLTQRLVPRKTFVGNIRPHHPRGPLHLDRDGLLYGVVKEGVRSHFSTFCYDTDSLKFSAKSLHEQKVEVSEEIREKALMHLEKHLYGLGTSRKTLITSIVEVGTGVYWGMYQDEVPAGEINWANRKLLFKYDSNEDRFEEKVRFEMDPNARNSRNELYFKKGTAYLGSPSKKIEIGPKGVLYFYTSEPRGRSTWHCLSFYDTKTDSFYSREIGKSLRRINRNSSPRLQFNGREIYGLLGNLEEHPGGILYRYDFRADEIKIVSEFGGENGPLPSGIIEVGN